MRRSILSPVSCQMYVERFNNSYMKGGGGGGGDQVDPPKVFP